MPIEMLVQKTIKDVIKEDVDEMSTVFVVMGYAKDGKGMEVHSRAKPSQVESIRAAINKSLDELIR